MDICHLKNAELEAKHQKYKGRLVLRGGIVKDDSGSYAVFTEQGSSASQMDSRQDHGYHLKIAGLRWTSSRRSIGLKTQVKWKMLTKLLKIPKSECPRHLDSSYHDTNGQNHGPIWKIQSFLSKGICTVILWQDYYGKGNLRISY